MTSPFPKASTVRPPPKMSTIPQALANAGAFSYAEPTTYKAVSAPVSHCGFFVPIFFSFVRWHRISLWQHMWGHLRMHRVFVYGMPTLCVLRPVSGGSIGGNTTPSGNTASRLCTVVETRRPYAAPIN